MDEGRQKITLYDQMSAAVSSNRNSLAGLTLDDVLANQKRPSVPQREEGRTLLEIIRDDESNKKDRKSWKAFKDKLRLKRAGSAWTSSVHIPASDIPIPKQKYGNSNKNRARSNSDGDQNLSTQYMADEKDPITGYDAVAPTSRPQFTRGSSSRYASTLETTGVDPTEPAQKLRPSISRHNSTRVPGHNESFRRERAVTFRDSFDSDEDESDDDEARGGGQRQLSAREAVAAQEAAEAAAAAAAAEEAAKESSGAPGESGAEPVTMSLMDLMDLEGSGYLMDDDDEYDEEDEEEGHEEEEGTVEYNCCVCMVRHKGAAFVCGHNFCRLCSRELSVSRGNCPLCNNFILEILDIF